MMGFDDTGLNHPESIATLTAQRSRLIAGLRNVQMFPTGTPVLELPTGMSAVENRRGTFHFNPAAISAARILELSEDGRENELLELGPFSKSDIASWCNAGEPLVIITEYDKDGVELRCACGTTVTENVQIEYFERTKTPGGKIVIGPPPARIKIQKLRQ